MTLDDKTIEACGRIRNRDDALSVVQAAVAAERKRCAKIAEQKGREYAALAEEARTWLFLNYPNEARSLALS
jgi:hypothetical protein